jgi:hypothetical protein
VSSKKFNNVEIPVYKNPMQPKTVRVKFKFDSPKVTDKGDYNIYTYGVENLETGETDNVYLSGFEGVYKALTNLFGIPGNDDEDGNPIHQHTIKAGTIVDVGCFQSGNDNKSKRYNATWVSGPVQPTQAQAAAPQQQVAPQPQQPPAGGQQPMYNKQQVTEGGSYHEADPDRDAVFMAVARDYKGYYFEIYAQVCAELAAMDKDFNKEEARAITATILIGADRKAFRYSRVAEQQPEPEPPAQPVQKWEEPDHPAWPKIKAIPSTIQDRGKRQVRFFDICVEDTTSESHFSVQGTLKKFGINGIPGHDPAAMWKIFNTLWVYRTYRDQGFESDAAVAAAAHELGLDGLTTDDQSG